MTALPFAVIVGVVAVMFVYAMQWLDRHKPKLGGAIFFLFLLVLAIFGALVLAVAVLHLK